jgi:hypothetical protein
VANYHDAMKTARDTIKVPSGNLSGGADAKFDVLVDAIEALAAEFGDFRTKSTAEIDELRDQLADARTGD